jgi:hypothetical protein
MAEILFEIKLLKVNVWIVPINTLVLFLWC